MSPAHLSEPRPAAVAATRSFFALLGARIHEAQVARRWTAQRLASEAGVSRGLVYLVGRGEPVSMEAALRIIGALGLKLEWDLVDPRRRASRPARQQDLVHSAMGEFEAAHFRALAIPLSLDEPYQHYQFAGRGDLVAWSTSPASMLHIENRTRFPDLQDAAGSYNAKRAYLGAALAERVGVRRWSSETHVMVALWSAEVLHTLRIRAESFRALCPDSSAAFEQWWRGEPPAAGKTSALAVLDPLASGRQREFISLEAALTARPRHRGYADVAAALHALVA